MNEDAHVFIPSNFCSVSCGMKNFEMKGYVKCSVVKLSGSMQYIATQFGVVLCGVRCYGIWQRSAVSLGNVCLYTLLE